MLFKRPTDALLYWYEVLQSGGVPLAREIYEDEEEAYTRVQVSRRAWTPSDALCSYIDIGKAIHRLSFYDRDAIKEYLLHIVGHNGTEKIAFNQWKYKHKWRFVMKRLWYQIPQGYKIWTLKMQKKE